MDNNTAVAAARPTAVSAATLVLVSCAFALYQITSLVLGPPASRQFTLSMSAPTVDLQDAASPIGSDIHAVVGELATIVHPAVGAAPAVTVRRLPLGRKSAASVAPAIQAAVARPIPPVSPAPAVTLVPAGRPAPVETGTGRRADRDNGQRENNGSERRADRNTNPN